MLVQVTVRIDGREEGNLEQVISGTAVEIEEQTRRLGQRMQQVVLERGFDRSRDRYGIRSVAVDEWRIGDSVASQFRA